jgi:hypothetical protein
MSYETANQDFLPDATLKEAIHAAFTPVFAGKFCKRADDFLINDSFRVVVSNNNHESSTPISS